MTRDEAEQWARAVGHDLGPWVERRVWPEGHYQVAECRTCYARVTFSLDDDSGAFVGPAARSACRAVMRLLVAPVVEVEIEARGTEGC